MRGKLKVHPEQGRGWNHMMPRGLAILLEIVLEGIRIILNRWKSK